jgi:hypothetical protein
MPELSNQLESTEPRPRVRGTEEPRQHELFKEPGLHFPFVIGFVQIDERSHGATLAG